MDQLLNIPESLDRNKLDQIQQRPTITAMSEEPEIKERLDAIDGTSSVKARGGCGIPAEIWKYGGSALQEKVFDLVLLIWKRERVPQDHKTGKTLALFPY